MNGDRLHEFDLQLCDYLAANIPEVLLKETEETPCRRRKHGAPHHRARQVEKTLSSGPLTAYIKRRHAPDLDAGQTRLLLNDSELRWLALTFVGDLDRDWEPDKALHRRYVQTVMEVRDGLSRQVAEGWSEDCVGFARRLEEEQVRLSEGIEVIHEWVSSLRTLLRGMRATDLLPCPEGRSPTPTTLAGTPAMVITDPRYAGLSESEVTDIERMQQAILGHQDGNKVKPKTLIKAAHISNQRGRQALGWLWHNEGYRGFSRPPKHPSPHHAKQ